jgi:hypothetical protein
MKTGMEGAYGTIGRRQIGWSAIHPIYMARCRYYAANAEHLQDAAKKELRGGWQTGAHRGYLYGCVPRGDVDALPAFR